MARLLILFRLVVFVAILVVCASLQAQNQPTESANQRSKIAFQLLETGLITEGIAHDPQTGTYYISSVRERKIISYSPKQGVHTFSQPGDSLWGVFGMKVDIAQPHGGHSCRHRSGVFGMKVDIARRQLWVCSSALPQMKGNTPASDGRTELVVYDLKTKKLVHTYTVPVNGKPHLLGDLTIAKNGTVYATDSRTPWLFRLATGEQTVTPFLTDSLFRSLQGLALSEDEQTIYVADYQYGLLSINLSTKQVTRLCTEQKVDLSGIDGLYYYQNSLIDIQNRAKPYRITRLYLSAKGASIERVETLETDHPLMTEPTLGVIANEQFYYVANSQWEAFDEAGKPVPNFHAQKPTILVLPLN